MHHPPTYKQPQNKAKREAIAVALVYDLDASPPAVVASGRGSVAERIVDLAFANGVKVREDADLAEVLAAVDLEAAIPPEAFVAVAEILAYVYRANGALLASEGAAE